MIAKFIRSLFSTSKATDTALDIVRKITGTDGMTEQEKATFILEYMRVTSNQSLSRRVIAIGVTALYVYLVLAWSLCLFLGAGEMRGAIEEFLDRIVLNPFNLILSFYFVVHIAKNIKGS